MSTLEQLAEAALARREAAAIVTGGKIEPVPACANCGRACVVTVVQEHAGEEWHLCYRCGGNTETPTGAPNR